MTHPLNTLRATHYALRSTHYALRATHYALLTTLLILAAFPFSLKADGPWAAKASLDINVPSKWKTGNVATRLYNSGFGFSVGGVYSHYFTDNFYLEPSLSLFYDTYASDFSIMEGEGFREEKPTTYKVGLRLPVVAGYTFDISDDFSISVFTGPELNYAFAGGNRFKSKVLQEELGGIFGSEDGMQRRISATWKGGLTFPFGDWRIDFEAAVGMTDLIVGPASMRENRVSISLLRYF